MKGDESVILSKRAEPFTGIGRLFRYVSAAQPPMQFAISCQTTSHQSQQQGRRKCPARFSFRIPSPYINPLLSHPHTNRPNPQHHPVNHKRENQRLHNLSERIRPFERRQGVENPGRDKPRDQLLQQRNHFFHQIIHDRSLLESKKTLLLKQQCRPVMSRHSKPSARGRNARDHLSPRITYPAESDPRPSLPPSAPPHEG